MNNEFVFRCQKTEQKNVIIPMLENPENRNGWPEMVCEDVSRQLYSLRGTVYRMWGQLRGQTLLPLPFGLETLERAERHALDT
ncbi:hypothetical protein SK128_011279 [Halocaridina rubra]|uniref:Uncharacterized protein n=1 Tax=Halocaridina rubra TaxID=373956 RepID=A0AAN8WTF3_HALRR